MAAAPAVTFIDGSVLEGGGQLVRNAVALSALLARPIAISNVRNNRKPPGLKPQHVAGLKLAADVCGARLEGAVEGSTEVSFHPGRPKAGNYLADPGTAGSTTLLLQVSLPCLLYASPASSPASSPTQSILTLRGGTNATSAPQIDYTAQVFLPFLRQHFHLEPHLDIQKRGYFPRGGGEISLCMPPTPGPLPAVALTHRGAVTMIKGRAFVAGTLPLHISRKMSEAATMRLVASGVDPALIDIQAGRDDGMEAVGSGSGIILWAETDGKCIIGGSSVGSKGTDAAKTGENAADELARNLRHGGCTDEYLQDQIIIFLALAKGKSTIATGPLTLHTKTAIWLAENLTDARFQIECEPGRGRTLLSCDGIGIGPELTL